MHTTSCVCSLTVTETRSDASDECKVAPLKALDAQGGTVSIGHCPEVEGLSASYYDSMHLPCLSVLEQLLLQGCPMTNIHVLSVALHARK